MTVIIIYIYNVDGFQQLTFINYYLLSLRLDYSFWQFGKTTGVPHFWSNHDTLMTLVYVGIIPVHSYVPLPAGLQSSTLLDVPEKKKKQKKTTG